MHADTYTKNDVLSIQQSIVNHVEYTLARTRHKFDNLEAYLATAYSLRDRLIEVRAAHHLATQLSLSCALFLRIHLPTHLTLSCPLRLLLLQVLS